jgi:hypothetical protein
LSLDNDDKPDNILIWQGYGVDSFMGSPPPCGETATVHDQSFVYESGQYGFILAPDNRRIDENNTRATFGRAVGPAPPEPFVPLGRQEGIFRFRELNYLEAFYSQHVGDDNAGRKDDSSLNKTLGVILRGHGKSRDICEYQTSGTPVKHELD